MPSAELIELVKHSTGRILIVTSFPLYLDFFDIGVENFPAPENVAHLNEVIISEIC